MQASLAHSADPGTRTLELLEDARRYNRWIFARIAGALGNRVLEIGCGTGTITEFIADRQLVVGLDVDPVHVRRAGDRFAGRANVTIKLLDITRSTAGLESYGFDSAIAVNVLEHIADDVGALKAVRRILAPEGTLALLVPAHPRLMSDFDRAIGHLRRYTKRELGDKLQAAGFRVDRIRRSNPVGALGWLINNTLLRSRRLSGVRIYDQLVPALAWLDRTIEFPIGLSLVAVGRKR
jgi:SAM-dependent methyltransferase